MNKKQVVENFSEALRNAGNERISELDKKATRIENIKESVEEERENSNRKLHEFEKNSSYDYLLGKEEKFIDNKI